MRKNKKGSFIVSTLTTLIIVVMLIISGPAQAVSVIISGLLPSYTQSNDVKFQVKIEINDADKFVPVTNISLNLTGPASKNRVFALDGTPIAGDSIITIKPVSVPQPDHFGYGYGYGVDNTSGYGYNFGYGYGYGYNSGRGGGTLTYEYTVSIETDSLPTGNYTVIASLNTGNPAKPSFASAPQKFTLNPQPPECNYQITWLQPLAGEQPRNVNSNVPIKFNVTENGAFKNDTSVQVHVYSPSEVEVFNATYGEGLDKVKIDDANNTYITNFKGTVAGNYTVKVTFDNTCGEFSTKFELKEDSGNGNGNGNGNGKSYDRGSGGGLGGGGVSYPTEDPGNVLKSKRLEKDLLAGKPVSFSFPELGLEIVVTGSDNEYDVTMLVQLLNEKSKHVDKAPGTMYFNAWLGTQRIKEILVKFSVDDSWIASEGIAGRDNVRLYRWNGNNWIQLDTAKVAEDATRDYYEAKTTGLGYLAISGLKAVATPTPQATQPEVTQPAGTAEATTAPPEAASPMRLVAIIGVVLILIALAVVVYTGRRIFK